MSEEKANFLRELLPAVLRWQARTGLPASVVLAQAILESDWGRSALARRNHNLFGIKAHSSRANARGARGDSSAVVYSTSEYRGGQRRREKARFASYPDYEACLEDYARLLARPRYAPARSLAANPFAFAAALQRCGYATDPRYAHKLTILIRRYQLTQYDAPPDSSAEARRAQTEASAKGGLPPAGAVPEARPPNPFKESAAMRKLSHCRPLLAVVVGCVLLVACDNFERNAYRTLKVTKVEYELLQEHAARAYLAGRLTQEQWDRFAVAGNRFIAAHTLAADLMKTYQQTRRARDLSPEEGQARLQALERQVSAALAQLPVLLADLRALLESFERPPAK